MSLPTEALLAVPMTVQLAKSTTPRLLDFFFLPRQEKRMREVILKHTQDQEVWQMIREDLEGLPPYERHRILQQSLEAKQNAESFNLKLLNHLTAMESGANYDTAPLDPTWRHKAWKHVEDLCDEELQDVWARLLAQEIKNSGSCSLHTMDLLSRLSIIEVNMIDYLSAFVIDNGDSAFLVLDWYQKYIRTIEQLPVGDSSILGKFEDIGILRPVGGMFGPEMPVPERRQEWKIGNRAFCVEPLEQSESSWHMSCRSITSSGGELCRIGERPPNPAHLQNIIETVEKYGLRIAPIKFP